MAKKNVIRSYPSVIIVRILCWLAIIIGIAMMVYEVVTATIPEPTGYIMLFSTPLMLGGFALILAACVAFVAANIADDMKTLRVNEYGIQKKTQEFRSEVLTRLHNLEQENLHLIQQQDKMIEQQEEMGEKSGIKLARRSGGAAVSRRAAPKEEETDYELDLH